MTEETIGAIEYEAIPETSGCRGCFADSAVNRDWCDVLSERHGCSANQLIFVRKVQRLTDADFDQLKTRAIELYAGAWLHDWGRMVQEEVLARNGLVRRE